MKIAIVYTSRSGVTEECAQLLRRELKNHDVDVFNMASADAELEKYDLVVIGFPIRMGKAVSEARAYFKKNLERLSKIPVAFYVCCGFVDCFEGYIKKAIPACLLEKAVAVSCFGGLIDPSRVKGFDRILLKAIRTEILSGGVNADQRDDMCLPTIMEHNIVQFAETLKGIR